MSTTKTQATLVKMANQIGLFFESQTPTDPAASALGLAAHLKLFWAPAMRARLVEQVERGELDGVNPVVVLAARNHRKTLLNEQVHLTAEEAEEFGPKGGSDAG